MEKIKVLLASGDYISLGAWQKAYGLPENSTMIGKHFSYTEHKFQEDINRYGELIVCAPLMQVLDLYREKKNSPVKINSFNRDEKKQLELHTEGFRAATFSPHVVKLAVDCDTPNPEHLKNGEDAFKLVRDNAKFALEAGKELGIGVRVGSEQYIKAGYTFIHIDVTPEYYGKGKVWSGKPHPEVWEVDQKTW